MEGSLGQPHRLPVPAQLLKDYGIIHHNNQLSYQLPHLDSYQSIILSGSHRATEKEAAARDGKLRCWESTLLIPEIYA